MSMSSPSLVSNPLPTDSLSENGHEDKRQHPNEPKRNGPRRSTDGKKGAEKPGKDNLTKAQRRKEQNRAAQKAFRERREAKVRDVSVPRGGEDPNGGVLVTDILFTVGTKGG